MRGSTSKTYATEAALCADFIEAAQRDGLWVCYPETQGWDILAVRVADGFQIGIEAKLKFNSLVVEQALEEYGSWSVCRPGPDCRAVLVPPRGGNFSTTICAYIGISVIRMYEPVVGSGRMSISPRLPEGGEHGHYRTEAGWHEWCPTTRHPLPDYVPDCIAGSPSPITLTPWKIAAIKLAIILETRPVTRADFKHLGLDHRRWLPSGARWLERAPCGGGYIAGSNLPDFRRQHPRNWDEIKADAASWMPIGPLALASKQEVLV